MKHIFAIVLFLPYALNAMEGITSPNDQLATHTLDPIHQVTLVSRIIVAKSKTNEAYTNDSSNESTIFTHTAQYCQDPDNAMNFKLVNTESEDCNLKPCVTYVDNAKKTVRFSDVHYSATAKLIAVNQATRKASINCSWIVKDIVNSVTLHKCKNNSEAFNTSFASGKCSEPFNLEIGFGESASVIINPIASKLKTSTIETDDAYLVITAYALSIIK